MMSRVSNLIYVRLHNENSKLLSKTLHADEGMSHMSEAILAMETERQNIEVQFEARSYNLRTQLFA